MKHVKIAVFPAAAFSRYQKLFEVLSELYSIQFEARGTENFDDCAAAVLFGVSRRQAAHVAENGVRCMAFAEGDAVPVKSGTANLVLASGSYVAQCLRGRTLADQSIDSVRLLKVETGDETVARKGEDILWIYAHTRNASFDLVALLPPALADGEYAYQFFQRDNCMRLLPLVHFLREFSPWKRPGLRACLMFDDPNLHWKTYGCIRFEELARHAETHNYHASFATVPFDGWYVHPPTAALFQRSRRRLSLLVHGNNHTHIELAQPYLNGERQRLAAQALRRIERLEDRTGIEIARVMAAPHGGCSPEMAEALFQVGFEAVCVSRWSLMHHNPNFRWHSTFGLNIAERMGDCFPIIPRFKLARAREVDIYLAALLEKPIILVGHHDDLGDGPDILAEFAAWTNSVGDIQWMDMASVAQSNYCTHTDTDALHIKMYSRRIKLKIPSNINTLAIHMPWPELEPAEFLSWRNGDSKFEAINPLQPFRVKPGAEIEITSRLVSSIDPREVSVPRMSFWAAARRGFCEARDRTRPAALFLQKLLGKKRQS